MHVEWWVIEDMMGDEEEMLVDDFGWMENELVSRAEKDNCINVCFGSGFCDGTKVVSVS